MMTSQKTRAEKHRNAMWNHRNKNKGKGLIDLRLGWGTSAEKDALRAVLEALRNTQSATDARMLITNILGSLGSAPDEAAMARERSVPCVEFKMPDRTSGDQTVIEAPSTGLGCVPAPISEQAVKPLSISPIDEFFGEFRG